MKGLMVNSYFGTVNWSRRLFYIVSRELVYVWGTDSQNSLHLYLLYSRLLVYIPLKYPDLHSDSRLRFFVV